MAFVGYQAWVEWAVQSELTAAHAALATDDPSAAVPHLRAALAARPNRGSVHLLLSRASRRAGDLTAAKRHLAEAASRGVSEEELRADVLLLRGQAAGLYAVEPELRRLIDAGHPLTPDIAAAMIPAYLAEYQLPDADAVSAAWVAFTPDSPAAWWARAEVLERARKREDLRDALNRLLDLAPDHRRGRLTLCRVLLSGLREPAASALHAERLVRDDPSDAESLLLLAGCREAQGRADEAIGLLDEVLVRLPSHPGTLYTRGKLELDRDRPAAALPYFRRAVSADPSDAAALFSLFTSLQRTGADGEARVVENRWRQCEIDLRAARDLTQQVGKAPLDPEPRRQLGELFLRNGRTSDGVRWLESALRVRPDHQATHSALAAHYERAGRPDLARRHGSLTPR